MSTTVPVSRMPMPPVKVVSTANHHAQRWIDSIVALKPIVQRQKSIERSAAVPRSVICSISRSPPTRATARIVAAVHGEEHRASRTGTRSRARGTDCSTGCRSGSRTPTSSRGAGRCRRAPSRSSCRRAAAGRRTWSTGRSPRRTPTARCVPMLSARARRYVRTHHSTMLDGEEEAGHQVPAALAERRDVQAVLRRRRFEGQPRQLSDELDRIPAHRRPHVEADDLEREEAEDERRRVPPMPR